MTDRTIDLDDHRGIAAQKATELRRLLAEVQADRAALRRRHEELERFLFAGPAETWEGAAEKALYVLTLVSKTAVALDPRHQALIDDVFADFDRLLRERPPDSSAESADPAAPRVAPTVPSNDFGGR
jgi:uncharacterized protein YciI